MSQVASRLSFLRSFIKYSRRQSNNTSESNRSNPVDASVPTDLLGIVLLSDPPPDCVIDIIFVHGFNETRNETWLAKDAKEQWPEPFLMRKIPRTRFLSFGYNATGRISDLNDILSKERVHEHATTLLAGIEDYRRGTDTVARPIIFIAHGLGGLVCQNALLITETKDNPLQHMRSSVFGILYHSTPQNVYGLVEWAQLAALSFLGEEMKQKTIVKRYKQKIQDLHSIQLRFATLANNEEQPIRQVCCFERYPKKKSSRIQKRSGTQSLLSPLTPEWVILPGSRCIGIPNWEDAGYERVVDELFEWQVSYQLRE